MFKKPLQKIIRLGCLFVGVISLAMIALNFFMEQTASSDPKLPKGFIVYAKRDVSARRTITKDDIEARLLDEDRIPEDAVTKFDDAVGKTTKEDIQSGQIISRFDLTSHAQKPRN